MSVIFLPMTIIATLMKETNPTQTWTALMRTTRHRTALVAAIANTIYCSSFFANGDSEKKKKKKKKKCSVAI